MKKRLLVTGYGGFVAGNVVAEARDGWEVHALSRTYAPPVYEGVRCHALDLRDTARLRRAFREARPDAVIHAAALADIDYCESHRSEAEEVNVGVTRELARLCGEGGARLVFCSSDSVFDGVKGRYCEEDEPRPVNSYAETKVRAERIVEEEARDGVVARLSLVLGLPVVARGNSLLAKMISSLDQGKEVGFPVNEVRTPVDVITVARALAEIARADFTGILHLAGSTRINRHEMGLQIADRLGYPSRLIIATDSRSMRGRARRPDDVSLDNSRARSLLDTPMLALKEGLELALEQRKGKKDEPPVHQA
jgi:dTDP-4-dehydrorhamnose reductase